MAVLAKIRQRSALLIGAIAIALFAFIIQDLIGKGGLGQNTKDVGSILVGPQIVKEGIIDEVGGIRHAIAKLHEMME